MGWWHYIFDTSYQLNSDAVTIVNPLDKDQFSAKNIKEKLQYQYSGVTVIGGNPCAGLTYRAVEPQQSYSIANDTMIVNYRISHNTIVDGIIGYDLVLYYTELILLYNNIFSWFNVSLHNLIF